MSTQTGKILSCTALGKMPATCNWSVQFEYQLDAGGVTQAQVLVGNNSNDGSGWTGLTSPLWASPASTISLTNAPGTSDTIVLACPDYVAFCAFGVQNLAGTGRQP
jgi:hypothetical protein